MTVFGWDASNFDWSRGSMDLTAAYRDGIRFFTHKATEGDNTVHGKYGPALNAARTAGVPVLGAYHVVRSGPSVAAQVAWMLSTMDHATPWWRTHPNFVLQVDLERWPYDQVSAQRGHDFATALQAATGKTVVIYASRGQYGNAIPAGFPLWNAAYPSSRAAGYASLYPGDNGSGWTAYSGRTPLIWQYASSATIGGHATCDANAFRGSLAQLIALTGGGRIEVATTITEEFDVTAAEDITHIRMMLDAALRGFGDDGDGTTNLLPAWISGLQNGQHAIAAQVAGVQTTVTAQAQTITALSTMLQAAGGSPDVAPLVAQVKALTDQVAALAASEAELQSRLAAAAQANAAALTGAVDRPAG